MPGTGKDGRVTKGDMLAAIERAAAQPTPVSTPAAAVQVRAPTPPDDASREERVRWLLFTPHRGAASELRLTGFVDGELRNAVIDRSFIDADGTRWIVDYKTSQHAGGGLDEFIDRELARYAAQLRLYTQLARGLGPEPVRAALYFPWLGEFRELTPPAAR